MAGGNLNSSNNPRESAVESIEKKTATALVEEVRKFVDNSLALNNQGEIDQFLRQIELPVDTVGWNELINKAKLGDAKTIEEANKKAEALKVHKETHSRDDLDNYYKGLERLLKESKDALWQKFQTELSRFVPNATQSAGTETEAEKRERAINVLNFLKSIFTTRNTNENQAAPTNPNEGNRNGEINDLDRINTLISLGCDNLLRTGREIRNLKKEITNKPNDSELKNQLKTKQDEREKFVYELNKFSIRKEVLKLKDEITEASDELGQQSGTNILARQNLGNKLNDLNSKKEFLEQASALNERTYEIALRIINEELSQTEKDRLKAEKDDLLNQSNQLILKSIGNQGVNNTPGGTSSNTPGGNTPNNPGGNTPNNPGNNVPNNPGGNTPNNPGNNVPNNPGGNTPNNPGGNTPNNPGGNTPNNPGGNTPNNPGGNTPNNPGNNVPNNPGGNTPNNPGGNTPNNPGGTPPVAPTVLGATPRALPPRGFHFEFEGNTPFFSGIGQSINKLTTGFLNIFSVPKKYINKILGDFVWNEVDNFDKEGRYLLYDEINQKYGVATVGDKGKYAVLKGMKKEKTEIKYEYQGGSDNGNIKTKDVDKYPFCGDPIDFEFCDLEIEGTDQVQGASDVTVKGRMKILVDNIPEFHRFITSAGEGAFTDLLLTERQRISDAVSQIKAGMNAGMNEQNQHGVQQIPDTAEVQRFLSSGRNTPVYVPYMRDGIELFRYSVDINDIDWTASTKEARKNMSVVDNIVRIVNKMLTANPPVPEQIIQSAVNALALVKSDAQAVRTV